MLTNGSLVIDWVLIAFSTLFAMFGGLVKHLTDTQEKKEKVTCDGAIIQIIIGGFTGVLATMYSIDKGLSIYVTFCLSGLSGFCGVGALRIAVKLVSRFYTNNIGGSK